MGVFLRTIGIKALLREARSTPRQSQLGWSHVLRVTADTERPGTVSICVRPESGAEWTEAIIGSGDVNNLVLVLLREGAAAARYLEEDFDKRLGGENGA